MPHRPTKPQNYFLNESHELSTEEKGGGGRHVSYRGVDWSRKAQRLHRSLEKVERKAAQSADPLRGRKYYILADPVAELQKESEAKDAPQGFKTEAVSFGGEQSKWIERVGLNLIDVHPNGAATVHASRELMDQLLTKTSQLAFLGPREQARFVAFDAFDWIPGDLKFDKEWLEEISKKPTEGYIKLQPLISEIDADQVIRALEAVFRERPSLSLRGKGRTYLGRFFLRAVLDAQMVRRIAEDFSSIQFIHPPIIAFAESFPPEVRSTGNPETEQGPIAAASSLPCVAVVDTAVPDLHAILQPFRRGIVTGLNCLNTENDNHGSLVASRVVFGDVELNGVPVPHASCRFLEVRVGSPGRGKILAESVPGALAAAITAAPDVRVFNLSFDGARRLQELPNTLRLAALKHIEEVDNFAFDQDVVLVVAAGNAVPGLVPVPGYPNHLDDPGWELHTFPRSFNALTCGGVAPRLSAAGLAPEAGAPSPFSRIGPGFADSPKPDFCASAGNTNATYQPLAGSGVWGYSALGNPTEGFGTSFAAPILAREAAFVLDDLRARCPPGSPPFACAVKAVLALTADDISQKLDESLRPLAKRTLGYGFGSAERFRVPGHQKARFVWQGVIPRDDEKARIQLPLPREWVEAAEAPVLEICVAWDTPVSSAAVEKWSCRDVSVTVRPGPETEAFRGSKNRIHGYPLFKRVWDLRKAHEKGLVVGDAWTLEFTYSQIAAYAPGHMVPPSQRVAFAAEIWDRSDDPVAPHSFVQSLPIAATLVRLSNTATWMPAPITITSEF